jgi:hypothetical protein
LALGFLGCVRKGAVPLVRQLGWGETAEGLCFLWSYGLSVMSGSSEVVSSDSWLVSSIWFLLSTGQVVIGTCGMSLPVCAKWSICCLCQVAAGLPYHCNSIWSVPPPASFEYCPQFKRLVICHILALGAWLVCPTPALSLCSLPASAHLEFSSSERLASCSTSSLEGNR